MCMCVCVDEITSYTTMYIVEKDSNTNPATKNTLRQFNITKKLRYCSTFQLYKFNQI